MFVFCPRYLSFFIVSAVVTLFSIAMPSTVVAVPVCSVNAQAVIGGWGWENNTSCRVISICEDTPPIGDGWGWDGTDSCRVVNVTTQSSPIEVNSCVDVPPKGDGWGWDGEKSCAVVWSIASFPGWLQLDPQPPYIPYAKFTHIMHFAMYPTTDGRLVLGDIFTDENANQAVRAAHARNTKIILVVGGEGEGDKFVGATSPARLRGFVDAVIRRMRQHGYDGISIDWEEAVVDSQFVALIKLLATEFSTMKPRPLLTVDVLSNLIKADTVAEIAPYVDSVNIMSYFKPNMIENEYAFYSSAGLAANKVVMGIGLFAGADDSPARVVQKMNYAKSMGFKGAELWSVEFADWNGPLFINYDNNRWQ